MWPGRLSKTPCPPAPGTLVSPLSGPVSCVDVLGRPEPVDSPALLNPKQYGVIVSCGHRRGLLLPGLDGVDTVEQQLDIARQKGGIRAGEPCQIQRFQVVRHL